MAPNEHLINHFLASEETKSRGLEIFRYAYAKTAPGSGHELGALSVGLVAASMLLASDELNSKDVTKKIGQAASCLKPKDFNRVLETVRAILEEKEKLAVVTYEQLHAKYDSVRHTATFQPFLTEVENELLSRGNQDNNSLRLTSYFWVANLFCVKLPGVMRFPKIHELDAKLFIENITILNKLKPLWTKILAHRKKLEGEGEVFRRPKPPPKAAPVGQREVSQRPKPPPKTVPVGQNKPWKVAPLRELPSKDSPKKRAAEGQAEASVQEENGQDNDDLRQSASKKRRLDDTVKTTPDPLPAPKSSRIGPSTSQQKNGLKPTDILSFTPRRPSPLKKSHTAADHDSEDTGDESDVEEVPQKHRRRPIYLDHRQWSSRDPRIDKSWKRVSRKMQSEDVPEKPSVVRRGRKAAS